MRPYFKRHPYQLRIAALLVLLVSPILLPLMIVWAHRRDFTDCVKESWKFLTAPTGDNKE